MEQALAAAAIGLLAGAAASDVASRRIPNRLTGLLALVGLFRLAVDVAAGGGAAAAACDLAIGLTVFAVGALLFRAGLFGGGDVKLAAGAALWLGAPGLWPFLVATALVGGALALVYLGRLAAQAGGAASRRPSLPYGVAIAVGAALATFGR
jgi:prepilin peptidase CpaA